MFLVIIANVMTSGLFLNFRNFADIMRQFVPLLIIGISTLVVMSSGGIDLSVGSLIGLTGVIVGTFNGSFIVVICAIFVGLVFGLINGVIAVKTPIKAFIVTAASMTLIRGIAFAISGGTPRQIQVNSKYFPIHVFLALLIACFSFFLLFRKYGIVDNGKINGASLKDNNIPITYYLLSAFSAVITGIFLSFRVRAGMPAIGTGYEVDAIVIAILGGAVCGYAAINLISTVIAALLMAMFVNFFNLTSISVYVQSILKMAVLFIGFLPIIIKEVMSPKEQCTIINNATAENRSKYCTHCGAESAPNDTICTKCGCKL